VWNGGASNEKVRDLLREQKRREQEEEDARLMKRSSKRSSGLGRMGSRANTGIRRAEGNVRRSDVVMYDGEERRPVERTPSVQVRPMREVGGWRR